MREAAVERLVWAVRSAAEVGSSILAGPFHTAYPVFSGEPATEDERAWCAEVMRAGAEEGESCGVTLTTELLNRFEMIEDAEARALESWVHRDLKNHAGLTVGRTEVVAGRRPWRPPFSPPTLTRVTRAACSSSLGAR